MAYVNLPEQMLGRALIVDIRYAISRKSEALFDAHFELVQFVMEQFSKQYQMYISERLLQEIEMNFMFENRAYLPTKWEEYKDYLKKYIFDKK